MIGIGARAALLIAALAMATVAPASAPPNDSCGGAIVIESAPFSLAANTVEATTDADDVTATSCGCTLDSHSVWYSFTPSADVTVALDTFGSSYNTVLKAFAGRCGSRHPVACNDQGLRFSACAPATGCSG